MASQKRSTYRYRFCVPDRDALVREWINNQEHLSMSLRMLIKEDIQRFGTDSDVTCRMPGPPRGRPPGPSGRRQQAEQYDAWPEEQAYREAPEPPAARPAARPAAGAAPEPEPARDAGPAEPVAGHAGPVPERTGPASREPAPEGPPGREPAREEPAAREPARSGPPERGPGQAAGTGPSLGVGRVTMAFL